MPEKLVDQDGTDLSSMTIKEEGTLIIEPEPKTPDPEFPELVERFDNTETQRKAVSDKLYNAIQKMDLDLSCSGKGDARINEVKLAAINTFMGIAKDRDGQITVLENLRLKKRSQDSEAGNAKVVAEFLYNFRLQGQGSGPQVDKREIEEQLEQTFRVECEPFKEGELE